MDLTKSEINSKIFEIRGVRVMLDSDLAKLYQVETKNLNKAVSRNIKRFPSDFMFQLSDEEFENLRFQIGTFNISLKNRKYNPYVFTEQGVSMLSSVLRSDIAIEVNIQIMRTFVEIRKYALTHDELAQKIEELEKRVSKGEEIDSKIMEVLTELINKQNEQQLLTPSKTDGKIGFVK
ncbi:MAG: ORF6N domain-containing protein [Campylobacterota bacterium]|nr:ORF6N domain-containing protein [Campylobacterota bacterium]